MDAPCRLALVLAALTLMAGERASAQVDLPDPSQRVAVPIAGAPTLGAENAPITIVEFSDFYCPYCRTATRTLGDLMRIYEGQIRIVYRHSLLDSENATLAAQAAIAAQRRGRFWPFHDRLFAGPAPTTAKELAAIAAEVGIDRAAFEHELRTGAHTKQLAAELEIARRLGVSGVPAFFINGRPVSGAQPLGVFVRIIEEELAIAKDLVIAGTPPSEIYAALAKPTPEIAARVGGVDDIYLEGVNPRQFREVGLGREFARLGTKTPLVTIVEFSDFDCGYCARAHPVLESAVTRHPRDVRVIHRHYPLGGATKEIAEAVEEAGHQGKFWPFVELVFASRETDRAAIFRHAKEVGLDTGKLRRALDERTHAKTVSTDAAEGARLGVRGTPTLFINGRAVVGAPAPDALQKLIDAEIAAARELLTKGVPREELYAKLTARPELPASDVNRPDRIEVDPVDYHIAVLLACRESNDEVALQFYKKITDKRRRASVRRDCKRLGVPLPK